MRLHSLFSRRVCSLFSFDVYAAVCDKKPKAQVAAEREREREERLELCHILLKLTIAQRAAK